jgi:hypothetical protein
MRPLRSLALAAALAVVLPLGSGSAASAGTGHGPGDLRISVVSGRADLVTGGDALVEVTGVRNPADVRVRLNGRDVTATFAVRPGGRYQGVVEGLRLGRNDLRATTRHGRGAAITLTNHAIGGPVFAGPQVQPWDCRLQPEETGLGAPQDAQCNTPTVFRYVYRSSSGGAGGGFKPYDPAAPPADVATTTTDAGVTVPYVVRVETGVIDRGIYEIAVLFDPAKPWAPWAAQSGWNRKVVWPFGGGSSPQHVTSLPPGVLDDLALSRGYLVASSGLHVNGANVNHTVAAEALTMIKERVVEAYGPVRYTIGAGCSGGSIMQQVIAEQYPGLLDGILPNCSYPDLWTTATEVLDCGLLLRYFATAPGWTEAQKAAVMGTKDTTVCQYWSAAFLPTSYPDRAQNCGWAADDPRVYNAGTNPGGTRCSIPDYEIAIWGQRPRSLWTPAEQAAGHGFARVVADNTGVLYGLTALQSGTITPAQFADLNAKVGGSDIDGRPQPERRVADPGSTQIAYRAGQVTQGFRLDRVPMIDLRGSANSFDIHTDYHSWEMRARLDEANGHHANQVIWTWQGTGNFGGITPSADVAALALTTMDAWLAGIEADRRRLPLEVKVRLHKPADAVDSCWPAGGASRVVDPGYAGPCRTAFPFYADARNVAGERLSGQALKCRTEPLRRSMLPQLSDAEFAAVEGALPSGACDWSRRAVGYRPSLPWMTFTAGPGGRPLGPAPVSYQIRG